MCYYPTIMKNKRYTKTKKNGGVPEKCEDSRKAYIEVPCGRCGECCKAKAKEWKFRLSEELKCHKMSYFITLTFTDEELDKLETEVGEKECNAVAELAFKRFVSRWRKANNGKRPRYWFITELGGRDTERIHMHGLLFGEMTEKQKEQLPSIWKYGKIDIGYDAGAKAIGYLVKYMFKLDWKHKGYQAVIISSNKMGASWLNTNNKWNNRFNDEVGGETNTKVRLPSGHKVAMPKYFRNKIYTQEQRDQIFTQGLNKNEKWVSGVRYRMTVKQEVKDAESALKWAQSRNKEFGYGDDSKHWKYVKYNTRNGKRK